MFTRSVAYPYADAYRNIFNTIKTSGHSSLEKYTSHFIERVVCERELKTEQWLQHTDPPNSTGYHSLSFSFSWAAQPGGLWAQSLDMVLIPASSLQLIWNSCRRGYIIIWRHICTQFNPSTVKVIPWSPNIFDRMYLLFTPVHFFFWQLGRGQYVTVVKWFQVLLFNISNSINQVFISNLILAICLHIVKWFQVLLFYISNFIHHVFISTSILIICSCKFK